MNKEQVLVATQAAITSNVNNMTCDRIEALNGGHGMLNMAVHVVADVVADQLLKCGGDSTMKCSNDRHIPLEDIVKKAIKAAKQAGADGANAALIVATVMYLCGTSAQAGIPAGNRKLGAMARMIAKVDRCGVAMIPTAKMNSKLSGFPAVSAIYRAMEDKELCSVRGRDIPKFVASSAVYGHSALGEDIIWPQLAENGARIGTQAMIEAFDGAALRPDPLTCALFGAAAILEIIHPDAEVPEGAGTYGRTTTAYLVGKSAAATAGLPEKLHMRVTGEVFETAQLVGDLGLILKDIGGVSVIGMKAFHEILSVFDESISGGSGAAYDTPLGHIGGYCIVALKALIKEQGDAQKVAEEIARSCCEVKIEGESALVSINTVARKAKEICGGGLVTNTLIEASEPTKTNAIYRLASRSFDMLEAGASVDRVARALDEDRVKAIERGASRLFSKMSGKKFDIEVVKIGKAARRTGKLVNKYWSFDGDLDYVVHFDGEEYVLEGFCHRIVPEVAQGAHTEFGPFMPFVAAMSSELLLAGHTLLNCTIPAAVAVAMGRITPEEAAPLAELGAYVACGIPGGKAAALTVSKTAENIMKCMEA